MKKIISISAMVGFVLMPTFALASFDRNLTYGSKGEDVTELQEFLTDQGLYSGPITGNLYSLTVAGIKRFQKRESITPISGYFGPKTRIRANSILLSQISNSEDTPPTSTSSNNTSVYASSTASTIPTTAVPTPVPAPVPTHAPIVPSIPTPTLTLTPSTTTTTTPTPTPVPPPSQPTSIVQDGFDVYNKGTLHGQRGWNSYVNGSNFVVVDTEAFGGTKAIYNQTKADSVITKTGSLLADGKQAVYVKTVSRTSWGIHSDGNVQVRVSKNPWASGAQGLAFAAVSLKSDGNVAYYDSVTDNYKNFATYEDGVWTLLEIEWRSNDKTARYRVSNGSWTDWFTFKNASTFSGFDNVGFDFDLGSGSGGGVYFDSLQ